MLHVNTTHWRAQRWLNENEKRKNTRFCVEQRRTFARRVYDDVDMDYMRVVLYRKIHEMPTTDGCLDACVNRDETRNKNKRNGPWLCVCVCVCVWGQLESPFPTKFHNLIEFWKLHFTRATSILNRSTSFSVGTWWPNIADNQRTRGRARARQMQSQSHTHKHKAHRQIRLVTYAAHRPKINCNWRRQTKRLLYQIELNMNSFWFRL